MTKPTAKHRALSVFAGKWITQGSIRATDEAAPVEMRAIDRYEWLPGGFFMLHKVDALIGTTVSQSIEVIGYDAQQACYVTEMDELFPKLKRHLKATGMLWLSWPKGRKLGTDLTLPVVIRIGYSHGQVESTCLSVDATWSGLKFTHPKADKVYPTVTGS